MKVIRTSLSLFSSICIHLGHLHAYPGSPSMALPFSTSRSKLSPAWHDYLSHGLNNGLSSVLSNGVDATLTTQAYLEKHLSGFEATVNHHEKMSKPELDSMRLPHSPARKSSPQQLAQMPLDSPVAVSSGAGLIVSKEEKDHEWKMARLSVAAEPSRISPKTDRQWSPKEQKVSHPQHTMTLQLQSLVNKVCLYGRLCWRREKPSRNVTTTSQAFRSASKVLRMGIDESSGAHVVLNI